MSKDGGEGNMVDLLEKVKQGLDKGVTIVSTKSKEMMEATKVCNQIATLKDQKLEKVQELGCTVYSLHLQETIFEAVIEEKCQSIRDLDREIREKEDLLVQIHREAKEMLGIPFCQNCGIQLGEDDCYCRKCGTQVKVDS